MSIKSCLMAHLLVLAITPFHGVAIAQERATVETLDSRLSRIERVLDQSMLEQFQRVDNLQQEIRTLRGEIESLTFELETLENRNTDLYADADSRIGSLEQSQGSLELFDEDGVLIEGALLNGTGEILDESLIDSGSPTPRPTITITEDSSETPVSNPEAFGDGPQPPTTALRETATNAEKQAYDIAYDQLARGQIQESSISFDQFLIEYPNGPFSDNAWYWQGEAMYAGREFERAFRNFNVVLSSFPNSVKVPDARLKLGFTLYEQQQYEEAREILTAVQNDYPGRSASVLATKRLQKMDREEL